MLQDEDLYHVMIGVIRQDADVRRELSLRVQQGVLEKVPGALIMQLCRVDCAIPTYCLDSQELLAPEQTVFMSNKECRQRFGKAWTRGRSSFPNKFEAGPEFPDMVQQSVPFVKQQNLQEWNPATMAKPGSDTESIVRQQAFNEKYGVLAEMGYKVMIKHFARRHAGADPPMSPVNPQERHLMTRTMRNGAYDIMEGSLRPPGLQRASLERS
jgi:hypothetical protein